MNEFVLYYFAIYKHMCVHIHIYIYMCKSLRIYIYLYIYTHVCGACFSPLLHNPMEFIFIHLLTD